jgi:hypothetical protein
LDEVATGAQTMELAEQVAVEVWTKMEYVLNQQMCPIGTRSCLHEVL